MLAKGERAHLHDCVESLKRDVKDMRVVVDQTRAILDSFRVAGAVAKWIAAIVGAGVAIYQGVQFWKG